MKKKDFLIIFFLAAAISGLSFNYKHPMPSGCCGVWLGKGIRGLPLPFAFAGPFANEGFTYPLALRFSGAQVGIVSFTINVFFWFLVLAGGRWLVKKLRTNK